MTERATVARQDIALRIRTVKPEFYRSDDIDALDWETRFLFIALFSYVDDNGVGIDKEPSITADLFAADVSRNPRETLAKVSRGLQKLSERFLISRYTVDGKRYLHVTNWLKHQRIDKPNKPRYPLPDAATSANVNPPDNVATSSRDIRESPSPGTEDQGNRGTGDLKTPPPQASGMSEPAALTLIPEEPKEDKVVEAAFGSFWGAYPRKVGKKDALKAFKKAAASANLDDIISGAVSFGLDPNLPDEKYIPHPATWLNGERWGEGPQPAARKNGSSTGDDRFNRVQALKTVIPQLDPESTTRPSVTQLAAAALAAAPHHIPTAIGRPA
ncbi:hypothetical protein CH282_15315 [Rhodococcus sp. 06-418-1B]|nr:hypothetical protein [Rhodococcus sp. 06-418-1B]OZC84504.1 hypothetical protein CH282_15315 [Rhodococcus sp. 06-418-1B]